MARWKIFILAAGALIGYSSSCFSGYVYPGRPDCPFSNPGHTWPEYFSGKLASGKWVGKQPYFSIKFNKNIGTIAGGRCYTVSYMGNSGWKAAGYNIAQKQSTTESEVRVADPDVYEMNIWGAVMTFNEAGQVRLKDNDDLVGQMYCHTGSDCDH